MKNLPTYEEFNENYLPYFGVKQALDDSKIQTVDEKMSDFHRIYSMTPTWWAAWKKENADKYEFNQDAFSKTYEVSKDGNVLFIFDYARNKIFTNENPQLFVIKNDISPEELEKIKDTDVEDPEGKAEKAKEEADKEKEKEADTSIGAENLDDKSKEKKEEE